MVQILYREGQNRRLECLQLPDEEEIVVDQIRWGRADVLFTPAYWVGQVWLGNYSGTHFRIGQTLVEEVAACLLGGYGIPAELGLAAFNRVRNVGLLEGKPPSKLELIEVLSEPLDVNGSQRRYRFIERRSQFLAGVLDALYDTAIPDGDHHAFRDWFLRQPGFGPKTASWITRNWLGSEEVAVIDIHLYRAGIMAGFFSKTDDPSRDYFVMERKFLEFAECLGISPATLDVLIWNQMRKAGRFATTMLHDICSS